MSAFRPIYYLGCKNDFAQAIKAAVDELDPNGGRLGDLFAGTGAVAALIGRERDVTTIDIQEYSRVLCSAVLRPARFTAREIAATVDTASNSGASKLLRWCLEPLITYEQECIVDASSGDVDALVALLEAPPIAVREAERSNASSQLQDLSGRVISRLKQNDFWGSSDSTVSRLFGGVYFSYEQAAQLDAMLTVAATGGERNRDTLLAAALSCASVLVNTVGKQFAQPLRPRNKSGQVKADVARVVQRDRAMSAPKLYELWLRKYSAVVPAVGNPIAIRGDFLDGIAQQASSCSILYADPPYTRDHYSRFYHVLETMCLRDNPPFAQSVKRGISSVSRGLYREDRHQSDFCIRSAAPGAFNSLFKAARAHDLPLVLSYSPHESGDGTHPRVVATEQILEIANHHYPKVEVATIFGSTHNILNRTELKLKLRDHAEILVKCHR